MSEQYRPSDRNNDELEAILREFSTAHGAPALRIVEEPMPVPAPVSESAPAPGYVHPAGKAVLWKEAEIYPVCAPASAPETISEPETEPAPVLEDVPVNAPLAETEPAPLATAVAEKPVNFRSEEPRFDFMPRDKREAAPENPPLSPEESLFNWDFLQTAKEAQEETASPRRGTEKPSREEREKPERPPFSWGRMFAKIGLSVLLPVLCLCLILLGVDAALCLGPSDTVRGVYVNTMMETSALKFLPHIFLSVDEVQAIQNQNTTVETEEQVNTDLIHIKEDDGKKETGTDGIEIVNISGGSYRGKIMIVKDPSRVQIASLPLNSLGLETRGKKVSQFVKEAGAIAGINGGGFVDTNGTGRGGCPLGIVIKDGRAWYGAGSSTKYSIVGFDKEHKLVIGKMTGKEALKKGVVDAISFGPTLIVNRERMEITGNGSGLNPRTCIGQRADGAIVLLVIDGRHPDSIGASLEDCVNEMEKAGCVNATNLDGGSSSVMYYNGEIINHCASVYGPRYNPNCIIVK